MTTVIHEHATRIRTPQGVLYAPRTCAAQKPDGMWEAWVEFDPVDWDGPTLKTERETSQASREAVHTWASGLEPAYFEGAFARAHVL